MLIPMVKIISVIGKGKEGKLRKAYRRETGRPGKEIIQRLGEIGSVIHVQNGVEETLLDEIFKSTSFPLDSEFHIVIYGGDGSHDISDAVEGRLRELRMEDSQKITYHFMPYGTGADRAKTLGMPSVNSLGPSQYLDLLTTDCENNFEKRKIDSVTYTVSHKGDKQIKHGGLSAHTEFLARCTVPDRLKFFGSPIYTAKGAVEILFGPIKREVELNFNGEDYGNHTVWAGNIFNAPSIGGEAIISRASSIDDGFVEYFALLGKESELLEKYGLNEEFPDAVIKNRFSLLNQIPNLPYIEDLRGGIQIKEVTEGQIKILNNQSSYVSFSGEKPIQYDDLRFFVTPAAVDAAVPI